VRVDDIRIEAARDPAGVASEAEVPAAPSAALDGSALDLVPPRGELPLERRDEDPEIRVVRPGVHLRDEEDPHARQS
jgi:hypothetical protein